MLMELFEKFLSKKKETSIEKKSTTNVEVKKEEVAVEERREPDKVEASKAEIFKAVPHKQPAQAQKSQVKKAEKHEPKKKPSQASAPKEAKVDEAKLADIRAKAKEIVFEAKDQALKIRTQAEEESRKIKSRVLEDEKNLASKKGEIDARLRELDEKSKTLNKAKDAIEKMNEEAGNLLKSRKGELEKIASMTQSEAKSELLSQFDKELGSEKSKRIRAMQEEVKSTVEEEAQQLLVEAMRFGSSDYIVEYTTSKVKLPDPDMKGRIIGKEGRNIRALEELTGVEFDLDSNEGEILLSCFDSIRREIARVTLERLIKDGRIQPARIEDMVNKTREEVDRIITKSGDDLCHRIGAYNIPKELVFMLGKFKYRFSYGQNMIEHTLEETKMGVAIAHEIGADVDTVRLGCLFHDIGKIVTEDEGSHIELGVDLLNKHGVDDAVVNCVAEHHEDKPFSSIESAIVNLVDHVSGARPGARGEDYESYVKRMRALEDAAKGFDGVERVYAISAGREVRVFVEPKRVDDESTEYLAREIAKKIELEQTYPGVVKVTVIRETRVSETAK